jgi:hypothetical protein
LAIFDFAQLTAPLAADPHGLPAFLRHPTVINEQGTVLMPAQQPMRLLGHRIEYRAFGPGGFAHPVLQGLMIRLWNPLFHAFHVLGVLDQATDILLRRRLDRSRPWAAVARKAPTEVHESLTDSGQQSDFGSASPVFLRLPRVLLSWTISPRLFFDQDFIILIY